MIKFFVAFFALFLVACSTNTSSSSALIKPKMTKKSNCQSAFSVGAPLQFVIGGKVANPYLVSTKNCSILAIDPKSKSMAYRGYYYVKNSESIVYHIKRATSGTYHPPIVMTKVANDYYQGRIKGTIVALRSKHSTIYNKEKKSKHYNLPKKKSIKVSKTKSRSKNADSLWFFHKYRAEGWLLGRIAAAKYGRNNEKGIMHIKTGCRAKADKKYPSKSIGICISSGLSRYRGY